MDAGVADQLVLGDPTAPRFVYWDKKLRPTPSGPDALTFDLMSIVGKIRAGLGALGFKAPMPGAWVVGGQGGCVCACWLRWLPYCFGRRVCPS